MIASPALLAMRTAVLAVGVQLVALLVSLVCERLDSDWLTTAWCRMCNGMPLEEEVLDCGMRQKGRKVGEMRAIGEVGVSVGLGTWSSIVMWL